MQKRLLQLQEQSQKVKEDISIRAAEYITKSGSTGAEFVLPCLSHSTVPEPSRFTLVHEEALYAWTRSQMKGEGYFLYSQLQRVREQILDYPEKVEWSLDIGGNWIISRMGNILRISSAKALSVSKNNNWTVEQVDMKNSSGNTESDQQNSKSCVVVDLFLPQYINSTDTLSFSLKRVCELKPGTRFTPHWKAGSNGIKLKDFLRGQHVSLHRRDDIPVLCMNTHGSEQEHEIVIAVYISKEKHDMNHMSPEAYKLSTLDHVEEEVGRWFYHADFREGTNRVSLKLRQV